MFVKLLTFRIEWEMTYVKIKQGKKKTSWNIFQKLKAKLL